MWPETGELHMASHSRIPGANGNKDDEAVHQLLSDQSTLDSYKKNKIQKKYIYHV